MRDAAYGQAERSASLAEKWAAELIAGAHEQTGRASVGEMATVAQELLGQRVAAMVAGIGDPKAVGRWARGERAPRGEADRRLREAFQVVTLLSLAESPLTARAWLVGMNPLLGNRAPAFFFAANREGGARVMRAARAFLAQG